MNADLATGDKRPHPLVGTVVEPYAILDVIAAGGMGVVFKARHMLTDRIVAMKLLPSELARDESNVQRVKLEAKALAQLNHPNIVTTFDFGFTYMQEPFIVMEYVAGQSLKEVLDREVLLPVDRAIKIFLQAVDGMRYAHSAKILHRDLKPHNIMVSEEPEPDHVKILDFGVAKFAEYTQQITRTGEVVGSPLYMSPEQCTGRPTDHRCDIYSIGVMMFETLTGNPPFRGENYISTVHLKCTKLAPNFRDVVPGRVFPDRLETIVLKCLEIEPDKRYANMAELRADLELVAGGVPKVERSKTSQSLGGSKADTKTPSAAAPGEIGWKPAWSGGGTPNMVSQAAADDWSDSIVTGTEPDAWQPAGGQSLNPPNNIASPAPKAMIPPTPAVQPPQPPARQPVETWRDNSTPSVADDSWREPSSPNLSADDWNSLDESRIPTGLTGQWPQSKPPQIATPPAVASPPTQHQPMQAQDLASLSAALEAQSVSGPPHHATAPDHTQHTGTQSQVITGDHPTIQVGSNTVPVPTPNKDAADSHFVLTWDSKSGPAWSATTATPQKPRGPAHATNTRNPIQAPAQPAAPTAAKAAPQATAVNGAPPQPRNTPADPLQAPTSQQSSAEPAWAQAPPSGQQPSPWSGTTSGVINPAAAYGWRPPDSLPEPDNANELPQPQQQPQSAPTAGLHSGLAATSTEYQNPEIPSGFPGVGNTQGFTLPAPQAVVSSAGSTGQQMAAASSPQGHSQYSPPSVIPPIHSALPPHMQASHNPVPQGDPHNTPAIHVDIGIIHNTAPPQTDNSPPNQISQPKNGAEVDPWAELPPSASPAVQNQAPPQTSPPPNTVPDSAPQFSSPPSPWGPQPVPLDFLVEEKTVAVTPQNQFNATPDRTGAGSLVSNPVQPPPFGDRQSPQNSPIQQLAQRMADSISSAEDPVDEQHFTDHHSANNGKEFKNYQPVSLAELNAIKTPTAKAQKPVADSGLSNTLPHAPASIPLPGPKRNRFSENEDDTESGARSHASALRFNSSRGGNDGKKVVLMSMVGVAILIVVAIAGFKVYKYYEAAPQQAANPVSPVNQSPVSAATTSDSSATANKAEHHDTTTDTTSAESAKPTRPTAPRSQTAVTKKKATVATKPKKVKKAKAVAKAPATSPDVPATVKHRRAYSTYDSYYGN